MDAFNDIIARLEIQKQAIESALAALRQVDAGVAAPEAPPAKRAYNRRPVKGVKKAAKAAKAVNAKAVKKSGGISEEGRMRLAEAMKKRWAVKRAGAAVKKARKAPAKKAAAKKAAAPAD